jgi:hypothetical protein
VARFYAESGHDAAFIAVTGNPAWDGLYADVPDKVESRAVTGLLSAELVIVYMTTWGQTTSLRSDFEREFQAGWQAVLAEAKSLGALLCVLVHWNDGRPGIEEQYEAALKAAGVGGLVTRQHKNYLLRAADVLVAQGPSNMAIEAAILGTPAAYLQTADFDYATPLPYRGTPATIGAAIRDALVSRGIDDWQAFVSEYNDAHPVGDATGRVLDLVAQLCP